MGKPAKVLDELCRYASGRSIYFDRQPVESDAKSSLNRTVLVVEDCDLTARLYGGELSHHRWKMVRARNGQEALDLLRGGLRPRIILSDLNTPVLNGIELLQHLKAEPETQDIPVVVFSAQFSGETLQALIGLGAYAALDKTAIGPGDVPRILSAAAVGIPRAEVHLASDATLSLGDPETIKRLLDQRRKYFLEQVPDWVAAQRRRMAYLTGDNRNTRRTIVRQLRVDLLEFIHHTSDLGLGDLATIGVSFANLASWLQEHPESLNPGLTRTVKDVLGTVKVIAQRSDPELVRLPHTPTILMVDDDTTALSFLVSALEKNGFGLQTATSSAEGLEACCQEHFDLIILDIYMPEMDGVELCRRLRDHPLNRETPVIFVTCAEALEELERSRSVGGQDFITKPVNALELSLKALANLALRPERDPDEPDVEMVPLTMLDPSPELKGAEQIRIIL
jgi:CheY-like chemotaxis protein